MPVTSDAAQKHYPFIDLRHVRCGDLQWQSPDGERLSTAQPGAGITEAVPRARFLPWGVRLAVQPATQIGPVEGLQGTVVREHGTYRSWAFDITGEDEGSIAIVCRDSEDGYQWHDAAASSLRLNGQFRVMGAGVFHDPQAPPSERYKAVWSARAPRDQWPAIWQAYQQVHPRYRDWRIHPDRKVICVYAAVSPDGLDWRMLDEPLMTHMSDTDSTVYYDEFLQRYVLYTRWYNDERRSVGRAEAADFRDWGPVMPCLETSLDEPALDIYTSGRTSYPGLAQQHLMFAMFYDRWTQMSEIRLHTSTDGIVWKRVPGDAAIRPGAPGAWDGYFLFSGSNLVSLGSDQIGVPYHGTPYPHKYPRWPEVADSTRSGWATWRRGRLAAVVADQQGELFSFPMVAAGRELRLNLRTRQAGEVRVGVMRAEPMIADATDSARLPDQDAASIPGRTVDDCVRVSGDELAAVVRWNGADGPTSDVGVRPGETVMLQFQLRAAELFGFEWV